MICSPLKNSKGFTLVELMVSVGIFAAMTVLLLAKYGNFNQGILLTNLAYDVALTIRNAQSYGLNVKSAPGDDGRTYSEEFNYPYGVHFTVGKQFIFFADNDPLNDNKYGDGIYTAPLDTPISTSNIKGSSVIQSICVGESPCDSSISSLDITFRRPDPNAIITADEATYSYAEVVLRATDGSQKKVVIRSTGQIAVTN